MAIKCGKCRNHHDTVDDVRACHFADQQVAGLPGVTYGEAATAFKHRTHDDQARVDHEWAKAVPAPRNPEYGKIKGLRRNLSDALTDLVPDHDRYRMAVRLPGEEGRVRFFRVDTPRRGRWAGFVFIKEQAGDELYPVKGAAREELVINALLADVKVALKLYASELGACGICGRTLTDEESRARGIGPICADKMVGAF